ncbi:PD-(D/E)XK nuclease-like domain-containing protein [Acinetobacter colistiniresistens]|uniref:PD-(D/E)XK nuclease-like domain-containing protein n=1 Tax=Acinetobacter colistiniresistens TaxID=280145 RepID=UPI002FE209B8
MSSLITIAQDNHLIADMSNDEYHSRPEYSSSQLKDLLRSAAHFYSFNIAKEHEKESKKHLDFGTLAHALFLEPELFAGEFAVLPDDAPKPPTEIMRNAKNPSAESIARVQWWDAWEAENGKKITITEDQLSGAKRIVQSLQGLSMYGVMLEHAGMAEASIFFTDPIYDLQLRIRPDYHIIPCEAFPNGLILDVKTANDARPAAFSKACGNFAYDLSAVMYREGFQQYYQTEEKPDFIYLVAENDAPFVAKQYKASDLFLSVGEVRYRKAKELLAESQLLNQWGGYSLELEEIFLPSYMTKLALENDFN